MASWIRNIYIYNHNRLELCVWEEPKNRFSQADGAKREIDDG